MYRPSLGRPLAAVLTLVASTVLAAPGDLDPTFNGTGTVVTPIVSTNAQANAVVRQTDGKLVAAGFARVPVVGNPDNLDFAIVRYDEAGTPDPSFGGTGIVTTAIGLGDDQAQAIIQQTDGKLVAAGVSYDLAFNSTITLVRYETDGSLDMSFNGTGKVTTAIDPDVNAALALIQQTDLKLVVAGYGSTDLALVRYETNGSLDMSFNGTGEVTTTIGATQTAGAALLQQAGDSKLVVAGVAVDGVGHSDVILARYDTTGMLDGTFDGGTVTATIGSGDADARALVQQASDGKLVVAGVSSNGPNTDFMLLRYGLDGMPDGTFGTMGVVATPVGAGDAAAFALAQQDDGQLVAAGSSSNGTNLDFALVRYDLTGTPDAGFGTGGIVTTPIGTGKDVATALAIQPNGGLVAAGYSTSGSTTGFALARYLSLSGTTTSTSTVTTTSSTTVTTTSTTSSTVTTTSSTMLSTTSTTTLGGASTTTTTTTFSGSTTSSTLVAFVPGGPATKTSNDCYLELRVRGVPAAAVQKNQVVSCGDGSLCDQGPAGDGHCEVEVAACASQSDPNLPDCTPPASLESVKIGGALAGSVGGLRAGPACSAPVRVLVPIKLSRTGRYLAGKSKVVIKGSARAPRGVTRRKDTDKWTIQCVPTSDEGDGG